MKRTLSVGDTIALRVAASRSWLCPRGRVNHRTAKIERLLGRGGLLTDRDLRGCRFWHEDDVKRVHRETG